MNSSPHSLVEESRPLKAEISGQYRVGGHYPMMTPELFRYSSSTKHLLDWDIAIRHKLTSEEMWNIVILHQCRIEIFNDFRITFDDEKIQKLVQELEDVEYDLQFFWHFPMDHNCHSWWWQVTGCLCFGEFRGLTRVINKQCKLHNSEIHAHAD